MRPCPRCSGFLVVSSIHNRFDMVRCLMCGYYFDEVVLWNKDNPPPIKPGNQSPKLDGKVFENATL